MIRTALLLGLLLASCSSAVPGDATSDAAPFETSAESSAPPLTDLDAMSDAGLDGAIDADGG